MGDGTKFDFDSLRWWRFIDRNTHANPDALSNADPVRNAISDTYTHSGSCTNTSCSSLCAFSCF